MSRLDIDFEANDCDIAGASCPDFNSSLCTEVFESFLKAESPRDEVQKDSDEYWEFSYDRSGWASKENSESGENDASVAVKSDQTPFMLKVICDPKSYLYINGTTIDFKDELMGRGFVFNNPNATTTCGCGSSFSA